MSSFLILKAQSNRRIRVPISDQ